MLVRKLANEKAVEYGYKDWYEAWEDLNMKYKVIVAGTRYYKNQEFVDRKLDHLLQNFSKENIQIVEGGEPTGVDRRAREYAQKRGIDYRTFEADWDTHKKAAGPIRNREMAEYGTHLVAFWDGESRGTKNMINEAKKKGLKVIVV